MLHQKSFKKCNNCFGMWYKLQLEYYCTCPKMYLYHKIWPLYCMFISAYQKFKCYVLRYLSEVFFLISACKQITPYLYVQLSSCRWTHGFETCRRHRKNYNISLTKVHFVGLCFMIALQCTVQKSYNITTCYLYWTYLRICLFALSQQIPDNTVLSSRPQSMWDFWWTN